MGIYYDIYPRFYVPFLSQFTMIYQHTYSLFTNIFKTLDVMTWMCYYNNSSILYLLFSKFSTHGGFGIWLKTKTLNHGVMQ